MVTNTLLTILTKQYFNQEWSGYVECKIADPFPATVCNWWSAARGFEVYCSERRSGLLHQTQAAGETATAKNSGKQLPQSSVLQRLPAGYRQLHVNFDHTAVKGHPQPAGASLMGYLGTGLLAAVVPALFAARVMTAGILTSGLVTAGVVVGHTSLQIFTSQFSRSTERTELAGVFS